VDEIAANRSYDTLQQEVRKYTVKMANAEQDYNRVNDELKNKMMAAKRTHDELIESVLLTFVSAQVCGLFHYYL
jgi:hypothetical protein